MTDLCEQISKHPPCNFLVNEDSGLSPSAQRDIAVLYVWTNVFIAYLIVSRQVRDVVWR